MTIWKPEPVETQPEITPLFWRVVKVVDDHHIVLYHYGEGRTSSKIIDWNSQMRIATTRSGRKYHLSVNNMGYHPDAEYVFAQWKYLNRVYDIDTIDISDQYLTTKEGN